MQIIHDHVGNETTSTFCTNRKIILFLSVSPHLTFIKRHKEWKKGAVLRFTIISSILEKLRFWLITKQKLKCRQTANTQVKKIRVTVTFRKSSISLMCFSLIVLPSSPPLPVFNLWQLLRSHTWDFHDQKHFCAGFMQMPKENSKILHRAAEPG